MRCGDGGLRSASGPPDRIRCGSAAPRAIRVRSRRRRSCSPAGRDRRGSGIGAAGARLQRWLPAHLVVLRQCGAQARHRGVAPPWWDRCPAAPIRRSAGVPPGPAHGRPPARPGPERQLGAAGPGPAAIAGTTCTAAMCSVLGPANRSRCRPDSGAAGQARTAPASPRFRRSRRPARGGPGTTRCASRGRGAADPVDVPPGRGRGGRLVDRVLVAGRVAAAARRTRARTPVATPARPARTPSGVRIDRPHGPADLHGRARPAEPAAVSTAHRRRRPGRTRPGTRAPRSRSRRWRPAAVDPPARPGGLGQPLHQLAVGP